MRFKLPEFLSVRDMYSRLLLPLFYTACAAAVSYIIRPYLVKTVAIVFVVTVMLSAWSGGLKGGLLAAVISILAIDYMFLPPIHHLGPLGFSDVMVALIFFSAAIFVSKIVAKARQSETDRAARLAAESMNQAKDHLLSLVAHELRNPLSTISMAMEVWKSAPDNPDTCKLAMDTIGRALQLEFMFVNDLVDWARIKGGKFELNTRPIRLSDVIEAAWSVVHNEADSKGIRREISIEPDADEIEADHERLIQVVWNLFTNAVKFTPNGGKITVMAKSADGWVSLAIHDTGRGIAKDTLPHLFDSYWQSMSQDSKLYGGLGLGLSIARQIIERHGGRIRAESDGPDKGATFIIELKKPLRQGMS